MAYYYINYYYKDISYDDNVIMGHFSVLPCDGDVECDFVYDRNSESTEIYNANKSENEILPLPIGWLLYKLETQGYLNKDESRICF